MKESASHHFSVVINDSGEVWPCSDGSRRRPATLYIPSERASGIMGMYVEFALIHGFLGKL